MTEHLELQSIPEDSPEILSDVADEAADALEIDVEARETEDVALAEADMPGEAEDAGLSVDWELNSSLGTPVEGYTASQCARMSSGTQSYCVFSGAGR